MPRLRDFVECLGASLCEHATAALARLVPFETSLLEVARATHRRISEQMTPADLRSALRELVSSPPETVELCMQDGVAGIRPRIEDEFRETMVSYLEMLPEIVRQALRRPGDPEGSSIPEAFTIRRAEDWLLLLPDRLPSFRPGDQPENVENWRVENLRGLGPHAEVWDGYDDDQPELSPACLKFITDSLARDALAEHLPHIHQVLELEPMNGLIPIRSAYVVAQPACLEYVHLPGYDLANLMNSARWKKDRPRPEQSTLIVRRLAQILGRIHRLNPPLVHRGLKPSNVLLSPTNSGGVSVWVSDIGWGQITASIPATGVSVAQAIRRSLRGSFGPMYASPQQKAGAPPDPRDDIFSIGVIWYQLVLRDPTAKPSADRKWVAEMQRSGLPDALIETMASCLSDVPAERPGDGIVLADAISVSNATSPIRNGDSGTIRLRGNSGVYDAVKSRADPELRLKVKEK